MNANTQPKTAKTLTIVQRTALERIAAAGEAGIPISGKRTSGTIKPITANTLQDHRLVEFFPNDDRDQTWARALPAGLALLAAPAAARAARPLVPPGPAGTALRRAAKIPPLPPRRLTSSECSLIVALATHHLPKGKTPATLLDTRPAGPATLVEFGVPRKSFSGVANSLMRKGLAILTGLPGKTEASLTEMGWDTWTALRTGAAAAPATAPEPEVAPSAPAPAPEPATAPLAIGSGHRDPEVRRPPTGTILRRKYKGETHSVSVTETGYRWKGEEYSSLSAIGKKLTGHECNGWSWFGLKPATTGGRVSATAALADLAIMVGKMVETGEPPGELPAALERLGQTRAASILRDVLGTGRAAPKKAPAFGKHRKAS